MIILLLLVGIYLFFECRFGIPLMKDCCHWCDSNVKLYITTGIYLLIVILVGIFQIKKKANNKSIKMTPAAIM